MVEILEELCHVQGLEHPAFREDRYPGVEDLPAVDRRQGDDLFPEEDRCLEDERREDVQKLVDLYLVRSPNRRIEDDRVLKLENVSVPSVVTDGKSHAIDQRVKQKNTEVVVDIVLGHLHQNELRNGVGGILEIGLLRYQGPEHQKGDI